MDSSGLRHFRSSSLGGDRFLSLFSSSPLQGAPVVAGSDEFNEAEVCFTDDFSDPSRNTNQLSAASTNRRRHLARQLQSSGLLAALPASSTTPSKQIPHSRPAHREKDLAQTAPCRKFQQSAPVSVPIVPPAVMASRRRGAFFEEDDEEVDEEMLPPHEIVARRLHSTVRSTCSVLEGAGRTLKGRDLRQVRNAVWRKTGFLD